jgi:uncharacterized protein
MLSESALEIRKLKNVNLRSGILLDGFPSVGLANTIASECLVHSLKTELVGIIDSPVFPPLSVIRNAMPTFPARVYANEELRLGMFVSELHLNPLMFRSVARLMLEWALNSNCDLIVSAAGLPYEEGMAADTSKPEVYAVGSTTAALKIAAEAGIPPMINGSVSGIPAILLNEGSWRNYNVIVLLVKVLRDAPDFRAGAAIAEALARLAPGAKCDISALLKQAEAMEDMLKKLRSEQVQHTTTEEHIYG